MGNRACLSLRKQSVSLNERCEGGEEVRPVLNGDLERAKELLRTTDVSPTKIAEETGCLYQTVLNWSKKLRDSSRKPSDVKVTYLPTVNEPVHDPNSYIFVHPDKLVEELEMKHPPHTTPQFTSSGVPSSVMPDMNLSFSKSGISPSQLHSLIGHVYAMVEHSNKTFDITINLKSVEDGKDG